MIDADSPLMKWLWPLLAALAGSVTALSLRPFKKMSPAEIVVALFVGSTFSIFVTPLVIHFVYGPTPGLNLYALGGVFYAMATSWNILLPWLVKRLMRLIENGHAGGSEETGP